MTPPFETLQVFKLSEKWQDSREGALDLVRRYERGPDEAGNAFAFRKEARIWATCRADLESSLVELRAYLTQQAERIAIAESDRALAVGDEQITHEALMMAEARIAEQAERITMLEQEKAKAPWGCALCQAERNAAKKRAEAAEARCRQLEQER
jgi:hypothetical protein